MIRKNILVAQLSCRLLLDDWTLIHSDEKTHLYFFLTVGSS
jgi:hypothetical protein